MVLFFETLFIIGLALAALGSYKAGKSCRTPAPIRDPIIIQSPPVDSLPFPPYEERIITRPRPRRKRPIRKRKKIEEEPLLGANFILTEESINLLHDSECAICLEPFIFEEELKTLKCEHIFHIECIEDWFIRDKTCPICRDQN